MKKIIMIVLITVFASTAFCGRIQDYNTYRWALNIENELSKCTKGRPITDSEQKMIKGLLKDKTNEMIIDIFFYNYSRPTTCIDGTTRALDPTTIEQVKDDLLNR